MFPVQEGLAVRFLRRMLRDAPQLKILAFHGVILRRSQDHELDEMAEIIIEDAFDMRFPGALWAREVTSNEYPRRASEWKDPHLFRFEYSTLSIYFLSDVFIWL